MQSEPCQQFQIPSHRTEAVMLLVKIIGHLNRHITIDHEAAALISDTQTSQSSFKAGLPSSRGLNFEFLEHLCDTLHCSILFLFLDDFKGFSLDSLIHHDYVSNAQIAMLVAFLDHIKPTYELVSQIGTMAKHQNHIPREA